MIQDDSGGNEEERDKNENPKSPTANASQQETKVSSFSLLSLLCIKLFYFFSLYNTVSWVNQTKIHKII